MVGLAFEIEITVYQGRLGQKVNLGHFGGSILLNLHELSAKSSRAWCVLFFMFTDKEIQACKQAVAIKKEMPEATSLRR